MPLQGFMVKNFARPDLVSLSFPMADSPTSEYKVEFIDGLGPVKSELAFQEHADLAGGFFWKSRVGVRNIVITLELNPNYQVGQTPEGLRTKLYDYLYPGASVLLVFDTDLGDREIVGMVEGFETPLFVETPKVQISLVCLQPFFMDTSPRFESYSVSNQDSFTVENRGNVPVGFNLSVDPIGSNVGTFAYLNNQTHQDLGHVWVEKYFSANIPPQNNIRIDTRDFFKFVGNKQGHSWFNFLRPDSRWPVLMPGENDLFFQCGNSSNNNAISISFRERYIGL